MPIFDFLCLDCGKVNEMCEEDRIAGIRGYGVLRERSRPGRLRRTGKLLRKSLEGEEFKKKANKDRFI